MVLQAIAFPVSTGFEERLTRARENFRFHFERETVGHFEGAIVGGRQWVIGAAQGMDRSAQEKGGAAGPRHFPNATGRRLHACRRQCCDQENGEDDSLNEEFQTHACL